MPPVSSPPFSVCTATRVQAHICAALGRWVGASLAGRLSSTRGGVLGEAGPGAVTLTVLLSRLRAPLISRLGHLLSCSVASWTADVCVGGVSASHDLGFLAAGGMAVCVPRGALA